MKIFSHRLAQIFKTIKYELGRFIFFYWYWKIRDEVHPYLDRIGILRYAGNHFNFSLDIIICIKHNDESQIEAHDGLIWGGKYGTNYGFQIFKTSFIGFGIEGHRTINKDIYYKTWHEEYKRMHDKKKKEKREAKGRK